MNRFARAAAVFVVLSVSAGAAEPGPAPPVPVLVELFTSEGCSSCPPADALLIDLDRHQPIPGAEVIALGEHVDYWNDLGWKDRFSSPDYSRRQGRYQARFDLGSVYTPQMVVNGRTQFVGNDTSRAAEAIAGAVHARATSPVITIAASAATVDIRIVNAGPRPLDVILAVTESDLSTQIGAGENNGRVLRHTAVVRDLRTLGKTSGGKFTAHSPLSLKPDWRRQNLRAVVFLQDPSTLDIAAAAQTPWK